MSWIDFVAGGGGAFELRLVIEGWPLQFCTDGLDTGLLGDGRRRVAGMLREGISITTKAHLGDGMTDRSSFTASIVDVDEEGTASFTARPAAIGWMVGNFIPSDTTINMQDTSLFLIGDTLHVGSEAMFITGIPSATQITVSRAEWDSIAQRHSSVGEAGTTFPEMTTSPVLMAGRRAYLYAHTSEELTTAGTGTLIHRGVVLSEPSLNDVTTWDIEVDSLIGLLDQTLGAELTDMLPRGIYYPASSCLHVEWQQSPDKTYSGAMTAGSYATVWLTGFFEDQGAFATALDAAIAAEMTAVGHNGTLVCRYTGNDSWWLEYEPDAVTPKYLAGRATSAVDGRTRWGLYDMHPTRARLELIDTVSATEIYPFRWDDAETSALLARWGFAEAGGGAMATVMSQLRSVPRASYEGRASAEPAATASAPNNILYLADAFKLNATDQVSITSRDTGDATADAAPISALDYSAVVQAVTTATGAVELRDVFAGTAKPLPQMLFTQRWGPDINLAANFGFGATDLGGFRDHLVSFSPSALAGSMPLVTSTDFEDISAVVEDAAAGRHFLTNRVYAFSKGVKLSELLTQECRMLGCYLTVTSDGKLTVRPIRVAASTDIFLAVVDSTNRVVSGGFGKVVINPDAIINRANISTGYSKFAGDHQGPEFAVREVRSISRLRREFTLEIAPPVGSEYGITTDDAVEDIPAAAFGLMADKYLVVTVDVAWTAFDVQVGDSVSLTVPQLPMLGVRGIAGAAGVVIGREWIFTEAAGTLDIMVLEQAFAGYAPTARVLSAAGAGVAWTLNVEAQRYAPSGIDDVIYFVPGYQVQIVEWDAGAPIIRTGIITGIVGNAVAVTFTAVWAGMAGAAYNLLFDDYAIATVDQTPYAYDASAAGLLGGAVEPRVFAP